MDVFFTQSGQNPDPRRYREVAPGSLVAVAHTVNVWKRSPSAKPALSLNLHAVYVLVDAEM